jgi:hypothetical protein
MPGRYKNKNYHNEWYAKNKERLKADPKRKAAKKISDKKYYQKNSKKLLAKAKEYCQKNSALIKEKNRRYYYANRDRFLALKKQLRDTEEYKKYVKEYRQKNKGRINELQKITSKRHIDKITAQITDSYIVDQILHSPKNKLSRKEIRANKELIEIKRGQILLSRLKNKIKNINHGKENT